MSLSVDKVSGVSKTLLSSLYASGNVNKVRAIQSATEAEETKKTAAASSTEGTSRTTGEDTDKAASVLKKLDSYQQSGSDSVLSKLTGALSRSELQNMSASDRTALVSALKTEQQSYTQSLIDSVFKNVTTQAGASNNAMADLMSTITNIRSASNQLIVDKATQQKAQEAVSEDGYYGVTKTSERIYNFAALLAGGDDDKMKSYQAAVEKGFSQAESAWSGKMPEITSKTHEAVTKLFDNYYKDAEAEKSAGKTVTDGK